MMTASESVEFQQQAVRLKAELTLIGEDVARALIASGLPPAECEPVIIAIAKRVREAEERCKEALRKIEYLVPYDTEIEYDTDGDPYISFLHDESDGEWLKREQVVAILAGSLRFFNKVREAPHA